VARWLLVVLLLAGPACTRCSTPQRAPPPTPQPTPSLEELRPRYRAAVARARAWLDALKVDPLELREHGIKGKKKLVEQLEAYYKLWQVAGPAERAKLLARIREVVAITGEDRYHDMETISDRAFKEDATSYLRAALLMERLGLDTRRYRQEIAKAQPRLDAHLRLRGPHQRQVFHWYYRHFGLREPFPLGESLRSGTIAARPDPRQLPVMTAYDITHEVYALYEYGDRLDVDPFDAAAKQYLASAMPALLRRFASEGNVDLAGELLECMHYLRLQSSPAFAEGVRFLLDAQNADGSWGRYERARQRLGDYVRQGFLLHTTEVAVEALAAVFDRPMPAPKR
jgi:hypothetical protein